MTIQQLEYVIALDTYRHFVTAAEKCFVTQPTITLQLKKLEDEIGVQIFNRAKSPLTPTTMGELIIEKSRNILLEMNQLKQLVNEERDHLNGTYRIGIIPTIAPYLIPKFLGGFMKNNPETILDIEEMQSETIIDGLINNKLDIGILVTPTNDSSLREVPLYNEPFLFYGDKHSSTAHISASEVETKEGLWLLNSGHCFRNQVLNICKNNSSQHVHFKSGSIETLVKMVDNYGGFTLIPELASIDLDESNLRHFNAPKPIREVSLVTHKGFVKEALLSAIREEILNIIPSHFEKNNRFIKVKWR